MESRLDIKEVTRHILLRRTITLDLAPEIWTHRTLDLAISRSRFGLPCTPS